SGTSRRRPSGRADANGPPLRVGLDDWLRAIGLVLILEGLMPLLAPARWRDVFLQVARMRDGQIRFVGFGAAVIGCALLLLSWGYPGGCPAPPAAGRRSPTSPTITGFAGRSRSRRRGSRRSPTEPVRLPMLRWLLPENIADVLPSEARRIEELRRRLLDLYRSYGYELVMPPLIEHLDSLLTGSGADLGLRTFQLVDQLSGRTLGVRADMTPQVARIDAHLLNREGVTRLCYAGSVLHTRPQGLFATREPIHAGAELYGHAGIEADLEAIDLLVRSLDVAGVARVRIDVCHAAIVPALLALHGAGDDLDVDTLYGLLRGKDAPG